MRKIVLWGVSLVVVIAMFGVIASSAGAISRKTYEWCYANRTCFGVVNITKSNKTWTYRVGMTVEDHGTFTKSAGLWRFDFQNASAESCELRMKKVRKRYTGTEYCEGSEVEAAEWRRL
jgi:hypothetical protein